jgi:D-aminoacyl-tRNA deacylase
MIGEVVIICSRADPASLNIFECLQRLATWRNHDGYWAIDNWRLLIHEEKQIALSGIDDRLVDLGLHPEVLVFASRHVSKAGMPWLGGHFTGVYENGERDLSAAAPWGLRSFLCNLSRVVPQGFQISAEATHHGPTDMKTPSFFAEIGSSEMQWQDPLAVDAVARSILSLEQKDLPVFLGFGGGHYVQRQTELMLEAEIAFGHLFSKHKAIALDVDLVDDARQKSGAVYAYIDRKSLRSIERQRIEKILEELDLPIMRSKEIRARFPIRK